MIYICINKNILLFVLIIFPQVHLLVPGTTPVNCVLPYKWDIAIPYFDLSLFALEFSPEGSQKLSEEVNRAEVVRKGEGILA